MLGPEGWKPTASEAVEAGLVSHVVPHHSLMAEAQKLGEQWIASGKKRTMAEKGLVKEYLAVNAKESQDLADAFMSVPFLDGQYQFLKSRNKTQAASLFWFLKTTQPLWIRFK